MIHFCFNKANIRLKINGSRVTNIFNMRSYKTDEITQNNA